MNESIYYIGTSGDVRVLELPNGVYLGQFYCDSLKCEHFEHCAKHRLEHGDFDLLVIGDEEAQLSGGLVFLRHPHFAVRVFNIKTAKWGLRRSAAFEGL